MSDEASVNAMVQSPAFFYLFAGLSIVSALAVVLKKNPVSSAFALVLVFFGFAGIYANLSAHFISGIQIIVYTGAVMVLFIFVIMLLNADQKTQDLKRSRAMQFLAFLLGFGFLAGGLLPLFQSLQILAQKKQFSDFEIVQLGGNTKVLSTLLFSEYILPFELTSILLLVAIVSTVSIAKRSRGGRVG